MVERREEGKKVRFWAEPEKRLRFLIGLLIALTVLFFLLAANSPEGSTMMAKLRSYRQEMENRRRFQQALSLDPPLETSFKEFAFNPLSDAFNSSQPLLAVVFGGCEGCGARNLEEWAEVFGKWETVKREVAGVLVIRDKSEKVKEFVSKNGWKVKVVADEDGKISKSLNAFFSPRAYGFVGGKLVWVQKEVGIGVVRTLEEFVKVVRGEEEANRLINAWSAEMREKSWGNLLRMKAGEKR